MYLRWADDGHTTLDYRSLDSAVSASRSLEIRAILVTFSIVSATAVALRTYIRSRVLHSFGWDDWFMVAAQVLTLGAAVAIGLENEYGLGYHTWEQPTSAYVPYMKSFYASVVVYNIATCLVKIGILFQYRRVFALPIIQRITLYGIIFMVAWTVVIAFLNILICVPVAKFWDSNLPGRCLDALTIWYVMAGFNLVTDIAIFCLPLPVIKSLNLPPRQKIMLFAIFSLGFFTCIISIYRIRTLKSAASTKDPNWDNVDAAIWSFLEVTIAIITACLPTLRPFFSRLMPRIFASSFGRSNRPSNYGQYGHYIQTPSSQCLRNMHRTRTEERSKRSMDDTNTLHGGHSVPLPPTNNTLHARPYPGVTASIMAGKKRDHSDAETKSQSRTEATSPSQGGIKATTVVTQKVLMERVSGGMG
ncbi:hypothetical protein IWW34DRAFT_898847 [Fusarium oxysporum f. sp. albedinis]|nr:hypothetical protein IWW34DRAFT_898847 [Fusarium oxysporum f. sp. albedinis]KAK2468345.1 hypothetical protein H9L39_19991 [Fusarium oxysporum f. sp. albedinis]